MGSHTHTELVICCSHHITWFTLGRTATNHTSCNVRLWSAEGCLTLYENDDHTINDVTCKCNHLTSFVILMKPNYKTNEERVLSVLTNFALGISSFFLIVTLITITIIKFVVDWHVKSLLASLHYSLTVVFFWMLIMSTDIYIKIKHSFMDHEKRFVYCRYIGWIAPGLVVLITACVTRHHYASDKCWLEIESGAIWSFTAFVCIVILIVLVQMIIVGFLIYKKTKLNSRIKTTMKLTG
ncbi:putative adhesion G protein-coupled receptor E4P [Antedon mediterranea]|uniref:putative adhesion G protein-coupled receptor E4P n=1 Tax=Antedon mediterranea TaxID=105859 RepID=UPI003AF78482